MIFDQDPDNSVTDYIHEIRELTIRLEFLRQGLEDRLATYQKSPHDLENVVLLNALASYYRNDVRQLTHPSISDYVDDYEPSQITLRIDKSWKSFEFNQAFSAVDHLNKVYVIQDKLQRQSPDLRLNRQMTRRSVYRHARLYYYLSWQEELTVKEIQFASPGKIKLEGQPEPLSKVRRIVSLAASNGFVKRFVDSYYKAKSDRESIRNLERAERNLRLAKVIEEHRELDRRRPVRQAEAFKEFMSAMVEISELSQQLEQNGLARGDIVEDMFVRSISFLNRLGEDEKLQVDLSEKDFNERYR